jgi:uncharacterized protein YbcI
MTDRSYEPTSTVTEPAAPTAPSTLAAVSNALVALHKEHFGRGPTKARAEYAGPDALVCFMEDALLPAERSMVKMGEPHRVQESRIFFQSATSDQFVTAVERIVKRKVRSFSSALDPHAGVVTEIFVFAPRDGG